MTDALAIMRATKLGYEILSDSDNLAWFRKGDKMEGPFKTLDDAAYAAIDDDAMRRWQEIHNEED